MSKQVDQSTFESEVLRSEVPVLLILKRLAGCSQCEAMLPVFTELESSTDRVKIVEVDADTNPQIAGRFFKKIQFPGMVYLVGGNPFEILQGVVTIEQLREPLKYLDKSLNELKVMTVDLQDMIMAGKEAEYRLPFVGALRAWGQRETPKRDIPAAPSGDPNEGGCDGCQ